MMHEPEDHNLEPMGQAQHGIYRLAQRPLNGRAGYLASQGQDKQLALRT